MSRPEDETPPWHPWCGCFGCRAADRIVRRIGIADRLNDPERAVQS